MQRGLLLIFLLLFSFLNGKAQVAETRVPVSVEGFITNPQGKSIENVHIVNVSGNKGATSNWQGQFQINTYPGDTLRVTCVGYIPFKYHIPVNRQSPIIPLHIIMKSDTIMITGVEIFPWPADAQALKEAVLAMEDQTPKTTDLRLNDPKFYNMPLPAGGMPPSRSTPGLANPGLTLTIPGPITALYDAFSKEGKSRRKLETLVSQDQKKVVAARRYNAEVVKQVTSFRSDKDIQDFMLYCNLSVDFIVSSTEYDLYKAINECLLAYNAEKKEKI
ncbi:MAG: carboxypeptidase-like regulatory domain-containing protein [Bacteroidales bacterium]|nr:carboxypeptidase-like regulatory domain-containing protein [Bacteroidales bacterium]